MKTKCWIAILAVLVFVCAALTMVFLRPTGAATAVRVISDGQVKQVLPLNEDTRLEIVTTHGANVVEDVVFNLTCGVWVREGEAPVTPGAPEPPVETGPFKAVSATTEDNEYAVDVLFTGELSVGYSGSSDYFKDCEDPANIPTDYVEVYDAAGAVKEQDHTYTFKIIDKTTLRIVLVDDVYFAEGDKIVLKTTITDVNGATPAAEAAFTLSGGVWVPVA